jgi:hypothetical protein
LLGLLQWLVVVRGRSTRRVARTEFQSKRMEPVGDD